MSSANRLIAMAAFLVASCLVAGEAKPRTVYVAAVWASEMQEDLLLHGMITDKGVLGNFLGEPISIIVEGKRPKNSTLIGSLTAYDMSGKACNLPIRRWMDGEVTVFSICDPKANVPFTVTSLRTGAKALTKNLLNRLVGMIVGNKTVDTSMRNQGKLQFSCWSFDRFTPQALAIHSYPRETMTEPSHPLGLLKHGQPFSKDEIEAIETVDEKVVISKAYQLFRIPNQGDCEFRWTGRADGNHQILFSVWNGLSFSPMKDVRDAKEIQTHSITLGPMTSWAVSLPEIKPDFAKLDEMIARNLTVENTPHSGRPDEYFILMNCTQGRLITDQVNVVPHVLTSKNDPFTKRLISELEVKTKNIFDAVEAKIDWNTLEAEAKKSEDRAEHEIRLGYVRTWRKLARLHDHGTLCAMAFHFELATLKFLKKDDGWDLVGRMEFIRHLHREELPVWGRELRFFAGAVLAGNGDWEGLPTLKKLMTGSLVSDLAIAAARTEKALPLWQELSEDKNEFVRKWAKENMKHINGRIKK